MRNLLRFTLIARLRIYFFNQILVHIVCIGCPSFASGPGINFCFNPAYLSFLLLCYFSSTYSNLGLTKVVCGNQPTTSQVIQMSCNESAFSSRQSWSDSNWFLLHNPPSTTFSSRLKQKGCSTSLPQILGN